MKLFPLAAFVALTASPLVMACSAAPEEPATASDEAALGGLLPSEIVGTIGPNDTSGLIHYVGTPHYRALSFTGDAGDAVDAWVRSTNGDAVAWLLTSSFKSIAWNDNASPSTKDAHLHAVLSGPGTYYVVFRERDYTSADFRVSLDVQCSAINLITSRPCGFGGDQQRICLSNGPGTPNRWSEYGACENEIPGGCVAGSVTTEPCGNCGTRTKTCTAANTWAVGACYGEPANSCVPGAVQKSVAGCAVPSTYRKRTCTSSCTWSWFTATCEP
jgi:hypothetical protein